MYIYVYAETWVKAFERARARDVTTMHEANRDQAREQRGRELGKKNLINCFYGDKFPPGDARSFL